MHESNRAFPQRRIWTAGDTGPRRRGQMTFARAATDTTKLT